MSFFLTTTAVENTRGLAQSALPTAPVVADEPGTGNRPSLRLRVSEALRTAAHHELRLADRLDPTPRCAPQPN